jgi:hypothetical protein
VPALPVLELPVTPTPAFSEPKLVTPTPTPGKSESQLAIRAHRDSDSGVENWSRKTGVGV